MKLSIRNFAKILRADIEIDGITIIAGNNNIGKSTIGKTLDAVFNATYNIDEKMNNARIDSLSHMLRNEIEQNRYKHDLRFRHYTMRTYSEFAKVLLECESEEREEICRKYEERMIPQSDDESDFVEKVIGYLEENKKISDEVFSRTIYTNYFEESFHGEIT